MKIQSPLQDAKIDKKKEKLGKEPKLWVRSLLKSDQKQRSAIMSVKAKTGRRPDPCVEKGPLRNEKSML